MSYGEKDTPGYRTYQRMKLLGVFMVLAWIVMDGLGMFGR